MKSELCQDDFLEVLCPPEPCECSSCFTSHAYVPAAVVCGDCGKMFSQGIPKSPEVLGYLSADWAWGVRNDFKWISEGDIEAAR